METIMFTATVEKDGRIMIPKNSRDRLNVNHKDFLLILAGKYEELSKDFISDAFKDAIGSII